MRRPLADTIVTLVDEVEPRGLDAAMLSVTRLSLDVPIEFHLHCTQQACELLGDLPRWRWKTGFDESPGRLAFELVEGGRR